MAIDPFELLKAAKEAIATAIQSNRSFGLMSGVSAAGIVGASILGLVGGRADLAIFAVAIVIAFMFVLLVFVGSSQRGPKSRRLLAEFLAWAFSLLMLTGIVLMCSSYFVCWPAPFRSDCPRPDPRLRAVKINDFRLL